MAVGPRRCHEGDRLPMTPQASGPPKSTEEPADRGSASSTMVWRLGILLCVAVVAAGSAILLLRRSTANPRAGHGLQPVEAAADSNGSLRLKGKTEAVEKRTIQAPLLAGEKNGTLTILKLTPAGTAVKRGDILVEFDRQAQLRDFIDKQATSNDQANKVAAAEQNEAAARAKDETEMKVAEDNLRKAELEIQKVEILSRIDAEKAQENLEEAKATLAQL